MPENNIDMILEAFKKAERLKLVVVGNWEFSSYGKELRNEYKDNANLLLLDPIYDQKALDELRSNCKIYLHGHSVGGTNPSLVEAMNLGLLILAFDVEFNRETMESKGLYFSESTDIEFIINLLMDNKVDISSHQKALLEIAKRRYNWKLITNKYKEIFSGNKL